MIRTYGLLVFSHVTRSISTVQSALNLLNCAGGLVSAKSANPKCGRRMRSMKTHHLVPFGSPQQIVEREQHATQILQPFRSDCHRGGEAGVEGGVDIGCAVVGSRVLYNKASSASWKDVVRLDLPVELMAQALREIRC